MIIIMDASAIVEIVLKRENAERYSEYIEKADWTIAPDIIISELSNVMWKYNKLASMEHSECVRNVEEGVLLIDDYIDSKDIWKEALAEGIKYNHSIYDMMYLITARRNDGMVLTCDKKMKEIGKKLKIEVVQ